jgi:hypothetical protein
MILPALTARNGDMQKKVHGLLGDLVEKTPFVFADYFST